jgi:hypothetical protein
MTWGNGVLGFIKWIQALLLCSIDRDPSQG